VRVELQMSGFKKHSVEKAERIVQDAMYGRPGQAQGSRARPERSGWRRRASYGRYGILAAS